MWATLSFLPSEPEKGVPNISGVLRFISNTIKKGQKCIQVNSISLAVCVLYTCLYSLNANTNTIYLKFLSNAGFIKYLHIESLVPLSFSVWQTQYPHRCEAVWGPSSEPGSGYLSADPSFHLRIIQWLSSSWSRWSRPGLSMNKLHCTFQLIKTSSV